MIRAYWRAVFIILAAICCVLTACGTLSSADEKETLITVVFSADTLGEYQACG